MQEFNLKVKEGDIFISLPNNMEMLCGFDTANYLLNILNNYISNNPKKILNKRVKENIDECAKSWVMDNAIKYDDQAGFIYILKEENYGFKIGRTVNMKTRMTDFMTKFPSKVYLFAYKKVENYKDMEKRFHQYFQQHRLNGEWFNIKENDLFSCPLFNEFKIKNTLLA